MFFHCCTTLWYKDSMEPPEVFYEKGVLRNFIKFTGKHLSQSVFFNKVTDLGPATLFKKRLCHRCFPANFAKFIRTPFLQKTSDSLLMKDPQNYTNLLAFPDKNPKTYNSHASFTF